MNGGGESGRKGNGTGNRKVSGSLARPSGKSGMKIFGFTLLLLLGSTGWEPGWPAGSARASGPEGTVREASGENRASVRGFEAEEGREAEAARLFPWSGLAGEFERELVLKARPGRSPASRILVATRGQEQFGQHLRVREEGVGIGLPSSAWLVAYRSAEPVTAYLTWNRDQERVWVDWGEPGPFLPGEETEGQFYEVVLHGEAVAVQMELEGTGLELRRSQELRPEVSLLARSREASEGLRAVWTATDLQELGSAVIGLLWCRDPQTWPQIVQVVASDARAEPVSVELELRRSF